MPDNPEWSESNVDPGNFSGLGCQTRSFHETQATLTLMNSVRYAMRERLGCEFN